MTDINHMNKLPDVLDSDQRVLTRKEFTYRGSWKKRGGVGVFMMMARKWDRLEVMAERGGYDVFDLVVRDPSGADGTVLAEVRDLRRYLALVEAEMIARGHVTPEGLVSVTPEGHAHPGTPDDGGHHARQEAMPDRMDDGVDTQPDYPFVCVTTREGSLLYNVDRRVVDTDSISHLPHLYYEITHKEWEETPPYYQPMYVWSNIDDKWRLPPQYAEHWTMP